MIVLLDNTTATVNDKNGNFCCAYKGKTEEGDKSYQTVVNALRPFSGKTAGI